MRVLLTTTLLAVASLQARPGTAQSTPWIHTLSAESYVTAVATDAAGNSYVGGSFHGSLTIGGAVLQAGSVYGFGAFVAKYSPQGALLWVQQPAVPGVPSKVDVASIAVAASGVLVIGGSFEGGAWALDGLTLPIHPAGTLYAQGYVAQFDAQGNAVWAQATLDASRRASVTAVAIDASGTVYGAGGFNENQVFINRYSAAGVVPVASSVATGSRGGGLFATGLAVAADGQQLALAGWVLGNDSFTLQAATAGSPALVVSATTGSTGFVAGYSPAGSVQWLQPLSCGPDRARLSRVVATGNDFLVCGSYTGPASFGSTPALALPGAAGAVSGVAARLSNKGAVQWAQPIQASEYTEAYDVAADASGNAYVAGAFAGQLPAASGGLTSAGGFDAYLLTYSPLGALLGAQRDGGPNEEFFTAVALSPGGTPRLGGYYTFGGGNIAGVQLPAMHSNTAFVAGFGGQGLGAGASATPSGLTVFPNPARAGQSWELALSPEQAAEPAELQLFNAMGHALHSQSLPAGSNRATVPAALPAGCYLLQVRSASRVVNQRLVVE